MTVRYDSPAEMIEWAAARISGRYREDAQAIGNVLGGELRAVVVFDTFGRRQCNLSVVAVRHKWWFTRDFARAVVAYPFLTCRFARVRCSIPASLVAAWDLAEQLGCHREGIEREGAPDGGDNYLYGLLRREVPLNLLPPGVDLGLAISGNARYKPTSA